MLPLALFASAMQAFASPPTWPGRPTAYGYVDSAAHPVRCHWQRLNDRGLCEDVIGYADRAWDVQIDTLGFRAPMPDGGFGGSDALDIYLTLDETGAAGVAWVDCDGGDGNCVDLDPTDGFAGASSFVLIDARTTDIEHFTFHEFNHTCQYATDFDEQAIDLWEATAVSAEHWTDPDWTTSRHDLADFQSTPWISTILQDGYFLDEEYGIWSYYEYGATLWMRWLDVRHGDGTGTIGPKMWELSAQEPAGDGGGEDRGDQPDVLDAWNELARPPYTENGTGWQDDLVAFTAFRGLVGTDTAPDWILWATDQSAGGTGEDLGDIDRAWREGTLRAGDEVSPLYPLYPMGVAFFDVVVEPGTEVWASLEGDEDHGEAWRLVAIGSAEDDFTDVADPAGDETASLQVIADADGVGTVAVVNLGWDGMDGEDELTAAGFTLRTSERAGVTPAGCGCATASSSPELSLGVGLLGLLMVRRRIGHLRGALFWPIMGHLRGGLFGPMG